MVRPHLVLDIAGVIATNLSPEYWQELAKYAGCSDSEQELKEKFNREIRQSFWSREISVADYEFWLVLEYPAQAAVKNCRSLFSLCSSGAVIAWNAEEPPTMAPDHSLHTDGQCLQVNLFVHFPYVLSKQLSASSAD